MVKEGQAHADEDRRKREEIEARNTADTRVYQIEKLLEENRDKVSAEDERNIRAAVDEVKKAISEGGADRINEAMKKLDKSSHHLAELLYQKVGAGAGGAAGAAGSPAAPPGEGAAGGGGKEGDVIDAEFVDVDETKK